MTPKRAQLFIVTPGKQLERTSPPDSGKATPGRQKPQMMLQNTARVIRVKTGGSKRRAELGIRI
jgi:hypothetical protein